MIEFKPLRPDCFNYDSSKSVFGTDDSHQALSRVHDEAFKDYCKFYFSSLGRGCLGSDIQEHARHMARCCMVGALTAMVNIFAEGAN